MELYENKENLTSGDKSSSKIPLPKNPLPPVPPRLMCSRVKDSGKTLRYPLKTLNSQDQPNTSEFDHNKLKLSNKTFKQCDSSIDWEYKVFRDKFESIKIKEDDNVECNNLAEEQQTDNKEDVDETLVDHCNDDAVSNVRNCNLRPKTPAVVLEPFRIRNIKRSLKRPHSRELQGLTPPKNRNGLNLENRIKNNVRCSMADRLEKLDRKSNEYHHSHCYTTEVFSYLLQSERKLAGKSTLNDVTRACIVNWLMKINGEDGDPGTVQSACWYLDSISAVRVLRLEHLPVIAAACFWIAQKLKGPQLSAHRLVKNGGHAYSSGILLQAERNILTNLNFPPQPIVPHDFTTYLAWCLEPTDPGPLEVASSFIILCGILTNKDLCLEYASVLASAAIYNSVILLKKNELLITLMNSNIYKQAKEKCGNFAKICKELRQAVVVVGLPCNEYRTPFLFYSRPPHMIGKMILDRATYFENNEVDDEV